ncbi:MAG: DegV family protein [Clostridia bacterium]|nr:DegV family protein [Clostridia bacterium]
MKQVVITADSAADLPKDIADKYNIPIMPMHVLINGEEKKDGVDITAQEIFDFVDNTGEIPKTSAVSPGEYTDFFEGFISEGKAVVHLSFCSELSSTCRNAKMAASALNDVYVIDTKNLAGGIALLAIKGCEMRDKSMNAKEIYSALSSLAPSARVSYLLDSIDFLRRSGRCSAAAAFGANLLSIKPCAAMINGKIDVIKKYRGKAKAARMQYASEQLEKHNKIDYSTAFVYHSGVDSAELSAVEEMLKNKGFEQVITAFTGCMISLHSGRGALGIHFLTD